jgi:hypothetical protein
MTNSNIDKPISLKNAKRLLKLGVMTQDKLEHLQRVGEIAGLREKESYRLKGVNQKITACFPSAKVTLPKTIKLNDLDHNERNIVEQYKKTLNDAIRPIYEDIRAQLTEKVIVTQ